MQKNNWKSIALLQLPFPFKHITSNLSLSFPIENRPVA